MVELRGRGSRKSVDRITASTPPPPSPGPSDVPGWLPRTRAGLSEWEVPKGPRQKTPSPASRRTSYLLPMVRKGGHPEEESLVETLCIIRSTSTGEPHGELSLMLEIGTLLVSHLGDTRAEQGGQSVSCLDHLWT